MKALDAETRPGSSLLSSSPHPSSEPVPARRPVVLVVVVAALSSTGRADGQTDTRRVSCPALCWAGLGCAMRCALLCLPAQAWPRSALVHTRPSLAELHPPPSCLSLSVSVRDIGDRYLISHSGKPQSSDTFFSRVGSQAVSLLSHYGVPAAAQVICMTRATIGTKICQNSKICLAPDVCQLISSHKDRSLILLFLRRIFYIYLSDTRPALI